MPRHVLAVLACLAGVLALAPAASADFHGACTPTGNASVGLSASTSDGTMTFTGQVRCGTATSIEITKLQLIRPDGSVADAGPASCGPCDLLDHGATVPSGGPGRYAVTMTFNVTVGGRTFSNRSRSAQFDWDGVGQPVRVSSTAPSYRDQCSEPGGDDVFFEPDALPSVGTATFRGLVVCKGVDEIRIGLLRVTRPDRRSFDAPLGEAAHCHLPCDDPVTATGSVTGLGIAPGTYTVRMDFQVKAGELVFDARRTRQWTWGGVGPAFPR